MQIRSRSRRVGSPSLALGLLAALLAVLWIAGGASRADVFGQVVVRASATLLMLAAILSGRRLALGEVAPIIWLLGAAAALALLQLVPLPPVVWQLLPGRALFVEAAAASGQTQPWRPLAIVPGAAINAAASLIVPVAVVTLATATDQGERGWIPGLMLAAIAASVLVGLLQFSGAGFRNPLVNGTPGEVSGMFANRNHLALFLAIGCAIAPVWALRDADRLRWRGPVATGLVVMFALTILATGSRAGLGLGVLGAAIGIAIVWRDLRRALRRYPRWVLPALVGGTLATIVLLVAISVAADRAVSIDRMLSIDPGQDMRRRGLPTVLDMIATYFPAGSGLGGFDPIFRIHEPFALLKFTYFNHAHNDWLEIVLDAGLPGLLLLIGAVGWWAWASWRAWRGDRRQRPVMPKLGSAILFLVFVASVFDYPARTPMIMAVMVIAAMWLCGFEEPEASALPQRAANL